MSKSLNVSCTERDKQIAAAAKRLAKEIVERRKITAYDIRVRHRKPTETKVNFMCLSCGSAVDCELVIEVSAILNSNNVKIDGEKYPDWELESTVTKFYLDTDEGGLGCEEINNFTKIADTSGSIYKCFRKHNGKVFSLFPDKGTDLAEKILSFVLMDLLERDTIHVPDYYYRIESN